jgi:hypothetical protein
VDEQICNSDEFIALCTGFIPSNVNTDDSASIHHPIWYVSLYIKKEKSFTVDDLHKCLPELYAIAA